MSATIVPFVARSAPSSPFGPSSSTKRRQPRLSNEIASQVEKLQLIERNKIYGALALITSLIDNMIKSHHLIPGSSR